MPRYLPDTSVIVNVLSDWSQDHAPARDAIANRLGAGEEMVIAGHSIAEAFTVLTGRPAAVRITAPEARQLLAETFLNGRQVVSLSGDAYRDLPARAVTLGVLGGATHDPVIFQTAVAARADVLLTFNARHFQRFSGQGIQIVVPGESSPGASR